MYIVFIILYIYTLYIYNCILSCAVELNYECPFHIEWFAHRKMWSAMTRSDLAEKGAKHAELTIFSNMTTQKLLQSAWTSGTLDLKKWPGWIPPKLLSCGWLMMLVIPTTPPCHPSCHSYPLIQWSTFNSGIMRGQSPMILRSRAKAGFKWVCLKIGWSLWFTCEESRGPH